MYFLSQSYSRQRRKREREVVYIASQPLVSYQVIFKHLVHVTMETGSIVCISIEEVAVVMEITDM